jgi:hypothetical protein
MVAIVRSGNNVVCAADLEKELGLANNRVRTQLIALSDAGVLTALPPGRGDRIVWYQRRESPLWDLSVALYEDWSGRSSPD